MLADHTLRLSSGAATDVGRVRTLNEDSFLAQAPVFVVADGMGGHEAGEVASAEAVAALAQLVGHAVTPDDVFARVTEARSRVEQIPSRPGRDAGTTLTGVVVTEQGGEPYWLVVNVGDSRTYRLADGRLEQISVDHSEIQELLDSGDITSEQAPDHPLRHVVTRALGAGGWSDPDYWLLPIGPDDRLLVCTDGLTTELDDEVIGAVLLGEPHPQAAAESLVRRAIEAGGRDNVTAVVIDGGQPSAVDETAPRGVVLEEPDGDTKPRAGAVREA